MPLQAHDRGVVHVTSEQLRQFAATHNEDEYVLIDVRQPSEYLQNHIPGATLIPLGELLNDGPKAEMVRQIKESFIVFSCRSGGRSSQVAGYFGNQVGLPNIFNLKGGIVGWNGPTVNHAKIAPHISTFFYGVRSPDDVINAAVRTHKALHEAYKQLASSLQGKSERDSAARLADQHRSYLREIYEVLCDCCQRKPEPFDSDFETTRVKSDVNAAQQLLDQLQSAAYQGEQQLMLCSDQIDITVYDIVRNLCHDCCSDATRRALLQLAQQQKCRCRRLQASG